MGGVGAALDEIEKLAEQMLVWPEEERITLYRQIDHHLLKLEGVLSRSPNEHAVLMLDELKLHLIMMARLYEPDDHTDDQHQLWALAAIKALRGCGCFAVQQGA